ncbi:8-oxo-dGTP pyrophosphatase MutT (NUDIX family) [Streptomyces sp. TE33382]
MFLTPAVDMIDRGVRHWQAGAMRIPGQAARAAVLDPEGAVFMLRYDNEEAGVHWAMPGGGLDPGESPLRAAERELREETGWTGLEVDGTVLCLWEHDFTRAGVPVRQHEHIFLAYGPRRDPVGDLAASHAADGILGWRWWSPDDLSGDDEPLWPPQLPELLAGVWKDGARRRPSTLGTSATGPPAGVGWKARRRTSDPLPASATYVPGHRRARHAATWRRQ